MCWWQQDRQMQMVTLSHLLFTVNSYIFTGLLHHYQGSTHVMQKNVRLSDVSAYQYNNANNLNTFTNICLMLSVILCAAVSNI
jgi:hypothetical protein